MEVEELPGTELRNMQLLTVKLYTDNRKQYFERKQRDVDINPINVSDTTVNRLRTELNVHTHRLTHTYIGIYVVPINICEITWYRQNCSLHTLRIRHYPFVNSP
jgi:hypothetical protein